VATAIVDAARMLDGKKPVLAVFMSAQGAPAELQTGDLCIPVYAFPEAAAVALAHAMRYAEWRQRPMPMLDEIRDLHRPDATALIARAQPDGDGWLAPDQVAELLTCYGIPLVEQQFASTADSAAAAAERMGGAVALKGIAPGLIHKTEAGLVRLDLSGAEAVHAAADQMVDALAAGGGPAPTFVVQRMAPGGVEMIVGLVHDPQFGPVVACGAGGVLVELMKDVAVRLTPLAHDDAEEMLRALKTYPLLDGFRGSAPCDIAALEDVLLRVSALAEDLPQIAELDLNPVVVLPTGIVILDARVRVDRGP
jgi:acyl-CoA synthetase (NDP forming)